MSDLAEHIEKIFDIQRDENIHLGLLEDDVFYIMHSQKCVKHTADLRQCKYSLAMDNGFAHSFSENTVFDLYIEDGRLAGDW